MKSGDVKLQMKLARNIMETEMQQKHREKRKIRREIVKLSMDVKGSLGLILFTVVMYSLDRSLKLKSKSTSHKETVKVT